MAFARFNGLSQDELGNALSDCMIEVRNEANGFLAQIYSDRDGNTQLPNPFQSEDPNFFFHASGGNYRIISTDTLGETRTWRWVPMGTSQSTDVEDLALNLQSGIIPVQSRADLNGYSPTPGGDEPPLGGVVYGDANPTLNGYYIYDYDLDTWIKVRPLPDTLASLSVVSTVANQVTVQASLGVDPGAVKAFYLDLDDWVNTGDVTVRINGAAAIPVHDVNGNEMSPGLATGRLFLSNEGTSLRMIVGGDYMAAVATALAYVTQSEENAELAQAWAEGTEPGGSGTKSSKEWADTAAEAVGDVNDAVQQVALSAVSVGHIKMRGAGPLTPGYLAFGEGGVYSTSTYPELASWMAAHFPGVAEGTFPDWRDYSPRTAGGALGPAVGAFQQDSMQRITGTFVGQRSELPKTYYSGAFTDTADTPTVFVGTASSVNADIVGFDSGNSPGAKVNNSETRVKSFGIRWEIKAFGSFVNQGTLDLIALTNNVTTLMNVAVRDDVDQAAQSKTAAKKINILKNTLQMWEQISVISLTAAIAQIDWTGLSPYRMLRMMGRLISTSNAQAILRVGVGGVYDAAANYPYQVINGGSSTISTAASNSAGFSVWNAAADLGVNNGISFDLDIYEFNQARQTQFVNRGQGITSNIRYAMFTTGAHSALAAQDSLRLLPTAGNWDVGTIITLEGLRG